MNRRNFLRGFGLGAALVAIPVAVVSAAKDMSKEKKDVLDKLSIDENGNVFVKGGLATDGDFTVGILPDKKLQIIAPKLEDDVANIYLG